ncbi:RagB/SusD family nutrient uptake outer membrane protein [Aestuariibaculum sp. M13]|uniref:RagB/SusD family nutrient uptake outer membrane protein n=1 Tax=Aestuariibaculum sp. M13 TaxID=2967132 RepID=UPI002159DEA3|nr:RagB/SusD family nutrient uptake outer membrane protein [Aestuariibaculum sp. M13]MCR8667883.1 RagB/SusD family nutrient uptake outer membrane protein [Aestuariibaculum sp. M13]
MKTIKNLYKIKSVYILLLSILLIVSCDDLLEETPIDVIDSEFLSTEAGLESGITGLYNLMRELYYPAGTDAPIQASGFFRIATDLGIARIASSWAYDPSQYSPTSIGPTGKWNQLYLIIERCNVIIAKAEGIDMDQNKKDKLVAQARAMRAEVYMEAYTIYNNIVLKTEPNTAVEYVPADPADIWALVNSDLDFAISKLDWTAESGRYGQGVVRHIRGNAAMWQEDWQEAADQYDAIVEKNDIHYLVGLDEVFSGDRIHAESLYTYMFNQELASGNASAGGGATAFASMFVNRLYEAGSGEIIQAVEYGGQSFGWAFPNDYLESLYDQDNDNRFTTYYYDPSTYVVNNPDHPNFGQPFVSTEDNYRRFHFSLRKFHDENKPATSTDSYQNYIHYRFAETLLFGAEAHWRLGGNTDAKALEYINKVRRRAFNNDPAFDYTSITLDTYLEEHAREMALEHSRWFVLKRLGLLVERVNLHFMVGSNSTNVSNRIMQPHMVNYPIPQSEIDLMGGFPQPGY